MSLILERPQQHLLHTCAARERCTCGRLITVPDKGPAKGPRAAEPGHSAALRVPRGEQPEDRPWAPRSGLHAGEEHTGQEVNWEIGQNTRDMGRISHPFLARSRCSARHDTAFPWKPLGQLGPLSLTLLRNRAVLWVTDWITEWGEDSTFASSQPPPRLHASFWRL